MNFVEDPSRCENAENSSRYKMLKHYAQSGRLIHDSCKDIVTDLVSRIVLLGVPDIVVGFKDLNGSLAGFQSFKTLDIPSLYVACANPA